MKNIAARTWKIICGVGVIVGLLVGIPTALEIYGVYVGPFFGWFAFNSGWLLPLASFAAGIGCGWLVRDGMARSEQAALEERASIDAAKVEADEKADITRMLSSVSRLGVRMAVGLYFDDLRFAKEDMAAAGDPLCATGIACTAPVEFDGKRFYRISLEPKARALFASHEGHFFDEAERLGDFTINREDRRIIGKGA